MDGLKNNIHWQTTFLHNRWASVWANLGIQNPLLPSLFRAIVSAYTHSGRYYHTLHHLCDLFAVLDTYRHQLEHPLAVDLAVFYHDIIYSTYRKDNEERSAEYAEQQLALLGCSPDLVTLVSELIRATKRHQALHSTNDFYYFLDADLSILAAPPDTYKQYTKDIRQEYNLVPNWLYKQGRAKVLRIFVERQRIYYTNDMHQRFDAIARKNMLAELAILGAD